MPTLKFAWAGAAKVAHRISAKMGRSLLCMVIATDDTHEGCGTTCEVLLARVLSWHCVAIETPRADRLAEQRRALPDQPGVYLFRDARGRVIYVGKAKSIKKRVASHFSSRSQLSTFIDHIESLVVA